MDTMKALSLQQPWAQLLVSGHKPVENRMWYTDPACFHNPIPYRGHLGLFKVPLDAVPEAKS